MTTKGLTAGMVKESSRPDNDGTSGLTMMAWAGGGGGLTTGGGRGLVTGEKKRGEMVTHHGIYISF